MTRIVTSSYAEHEEAEQALAQLSASVALIDAVVVGDGSSGSHKLDDLTLSDEQRAACRDQLAAAAYLLVAEVSSERAADEAIRVLAELKIGPGEATAVESPPEPPSEFQPALEPRTFSAPEAISEPKPSSEQKDEEHIPILEEELRVGKREVVRGGTRVHASIIESPVTQEVELSEESAGIERRPANRRLSDEEVEQGGLLQERVVEISALRQEAVVSKQAYVHEELILRKSLNHRLEQVSDTVRHTEVEMETLPAAGGTAASSRTPV